MCFCLREGFGFVVGQYPALYHLLWTFVNSKLELMDEESDIGTPKIGAVYKSGQFISL
jgi:hypothetical protein